MYIKGNLFECLAYALDWPIHSKGSKPVLTSCTAGIMYDQHGVWKVVDSYAILAFIEVQEQPDTKITNCKLKERDRNSMPATPMHVCLACFLCLTAKSFYSSTNRAAQLQCASKLWLARDLAQLSRVIT